MRRAWENDCGLQNTLLMHLLLCGFPMHPPLPRPEARAEIRAAGVGKLEEQRRGETSIEAARAMVIAAALVFLSAAQMAGSATLAWWLCRTRRELREVRAGLVAHVQHLDNRLQGMAEDVERWHAWHNFRASCGTQDACCGSSSTLTTATHPCLTSRHSLASRPCTYISSHFSRKSWTQTATPSR